ncbi:MAG TPA: SIMPL domain-containing protein, partial [Polyangiaceae bacterium]|nr:SIMPL domain-containing protein [Polyangiaceae bacterium]
MAEPTILDRHRVVLVSLILGGAVVCSTAILARSVVSVFRIRHQNKMVTVTGSAKRRIQSDLIVWRARVQARAADLAAAYKTLSVDVGRVAEFVRAQGIDPKEVVVEAAQTSEVHPHDHEGHELTETTIAYSMEQSIEVTSHDIGKVARAANEATRLIEDGIYVNSEPPHYLYTKLAELKIQMLAEAAKDARVRADQIATSTGSRVSS